MVVSENNIANLVSIIIPVYNAELHIEKCVNSVLSQSYKDIECILINDGSTDTSGSICDKLAEQDVRVKVFHQSNSGVSVARNKGLRRAKGDWLMFVDSDDWIESDTISRALEVAATHDSDIVSWNYSIVTGNKKKKNSPITPYIYTYQGNDIKKLMMFIMVSNYNKDLAENSVPMGKIRVCWAQLFNKRIYKGLSFKENLPIAEDALFCFNSFFNAKKITFFNDYLYNYRDNIFSAMYKYRPNISSINNILYDQFSTLALNFYSNSEYRIFHLGIILECLTNEIRFNLLHKQNDKSLFVKIKYLQEVLKDPVYNPRNKFTKDEYKYFFKGDQISLYLCTNKHTISLIIYSTLLWKYLNLKKWFKKKNNS